MDYATTNDMILQAIWPLGEAWQLVARIVPDRAAIYNSKDRVPFLLFVETLEAGTLEAAYHGLKRAYDVGTCLVLGSGQRGGVRHGMQCNADVPSDHGMEGEAAVAYISAIHRHDSSCKLCALLVA
jgi:hypothetical protein